MALQVSTQFKALLLGPHAFIDIFRGAEIRIFSGAPPANADAPEQGARLATITAPAPDGLRFVQSGPYVLKDPLQAWQLAASAAGTMGWFRLCLPADDGGASYSVPRIDGLIGATTDHEMVEANLALSAGEGRPFDAFWYTLPPIGT